MNQPIPEISETAVIRIIKRDFPAKQFDTVMSVLKEYGTEDWQRGGDRVRLAVLKLANGDLAALRREIDVAKHDYRDVLAYAEYPGYMQKVSPSANLTDAEKERILRADRAHYQYWLNKDSEEQNGAG